MSDPVTERTALLVIGAGPYGVAIAAHARARGIDARVVGRPMGLWRDHMPAGMFLRSGADWHLDAGGVHTFQAFLEARRIAAADIDPIPIAVFLAYADWFVAQARVTVRDECVDALRRAGGGFEALLAGGTRLAADAVVVATGLTQCQRLPAWAAQVPADLGSHTSAVVDFGGVRDQRVLVVGGRQSAYEWAALAADHGAARIDVVHRHDTPRFERVSWAFVDDYID
jgi:cation diffusion facilitator CzcD-associated flavoprotein CzcO